MNINQVEDFSNNDSLDYYRTQSEPMRLYRRTSCAVTPVCTGDKSCIVNCSCSSCDTVYWFVGIFLVVFVLLAIAGFIQKRRRAIMASNVCTTALNTTSERPNFEMTNTGFGQNPTPLMNGYPQFPPQFPPQQYQPQQVPEQPAPLQYGTNMYAANPTNQNVYIQ